jgi:hypothetical protein
MIVDRQSRHSRLVAGAMLTILLSACLACVMTSGPCKCGFHDSGRGYVTSLRGPAHQRRVQAGVGWVSPEASYSNAMPPPFFWSRDHPNMVCGYVPWIPSLSQQGSLVFPP